ncbi:MAG: hypothetical protein ABSH01_20250 [Terriglobia bacterium]|jgi:hypothetical protein
MERRVQVPFQFIAPKQTADGAFPEIHLLSGGVDAKQLERHWSFWLW